MALLDQLILAFSALCILAIILLLVALTGRLVSSKPKKQKRSKKRQEAPTEPTVAQSMEIQKQPRYVIRVPLPIIPAGLRLAAPIHRLSTSHPNWTETEVIVRRLKPGPDIVRGKLMGTKGLLASFTVQIGPNNIGRSTVPWRREHPNQTPTIELDWKAE